MISIFFFYVGSFISDCECLDPKFETCIGEMYTWCDSRCVSDVCRLECKEEYFRVMQECVVYYENHEVKK